MNVNISPKQAEFIRNASHRYNFKIGATQCGKTFIDVQYVIPQRILERVGKKGLNLILGVTKETIERNVLEPMRDIWGDRLISEIDSRNRASLFGERVYCLGAEKVSQVSKMRGAKFKYVYIDEAVDMNEQVFELLKSRLSLDYSCCDATGNPSFPSHFINKFIQSDADVYSQHWTLYDNPFISRDYIRNLEVEYAGTVYYDRYILGKWTQAEGLIFPMHIDAFTDIPAGTTYDQYALSVDYGTKNAFAALMWGHSNGVWYATREFYYSGRDTGRPKTDDEYADDLEDFVDGVCDRIETIVDPSATSFIETLYRCGGFRVRHADNSVLDGIRQTATAMRNGLIKISNECKNTKREIEGYVWDDNDTGRDTPIKENDHTMDAMRYFVKTKRIATPKRDTKLLWNEVRR